MTGLQPLGVIGAGLASWLFGAAYYMALGKVWMAAHGLTPEQMAANRRWGPPRVPFVLAILGQILMAYVIASLFAHFGAARLSVGVGIGSAFFLWLGLVLPTTVTNHAFGGQRPMLTLIDGGHWLGVLLIQGVLLALFGVKAG